MNRATAFDRVAEPPTRCCKLKRYVQSGKTVVVDIDLERFFDRINHDLLRDEMRCSVSKRR